MKRVQILGTGCPKCRRLAANAEEAVREMGLEATVEKISDVNEIVRFGVMLTPSLAMDGVVKSSGEVLSVAEIRKLLSQQDAS